MATSIASIASNYTALFNVIKPSIEEQATKGYIDGATYGTVFLGSIQAVLEKAFLAETLDKDLELKQADINLRTQQKLTEAEQTAILTYNKVNILPQELALKQKQVSVSQKQLEGFDKDMHYKIAKNSNELLSMLATSGATDGYGWLADTIKLAYELMSDGKMDLKTDATSTTVKLDMASTTAGGLTEQTTAAQ